MNFAEELMMSAWISRHEITHGRKMKRVIEKIKKLCWKESDKGLTQFYTGSLLEGFERFEIEYLIEHLEKECGFVCAQSDLNFWRLLISWDQEESSDV